MPNWGPALLAMVIASGIAILDIATNRYSGTFFTIWKSPALYGYGLVYGLVAFLLVVSNAVHAVEVAGLSNTWLQAGAIGISIKALLHIRFFSLSNKTTGVEQDSNAFPIGVETFTQIFEAPLLKILDQEQVHGLRLMLDPYVQQYNNFDQVLEKMAKHSLRNVSWHERLSMKRDIEAKFPDASNDVKVFEAMLIYLLLMGKKNFMYVFPLGEEIQENTSP